MESLVDIWEERRSTLYTHNWWHTALYYLKQGNHRKVLEIYDSRIWQHLVPGFLPDAIGAISLSIRLDLRVVDVGDRWSDIGNSVPERIHDHIVPLYDLHYIYALARTDQDDLVTQLLNSIHAHGKAAKPLQSARTEDINVLDGLMHRSDLSRYSAATA